MTDSSPPSLLAVLVVVVLVLVRESLAVSVLNLLVIAEIVSVPSSTDKLLISASIFLSWLNLMGKAGKENTSCSLMVEMVGAGLTPGMSSWGAPTATFITQRTRRNISVMMSASWCQLSPC